MLLRCTHIGPVVGCPRMIQLSSSGQMPELIQRDRQN